MHQVLEDLRPAQVGRRLDIVIGDLPVCHADVALLKQVLINLLSNAIKFTSKGEVASIAVGCQRTGDQYVYCIKDNGVGVDMRYAHKRFGVFQRLHRAEEYEGTGVGSPLCNASSTATVGASGPRRQWISPRTR